MSEPGDVEDTDLTMPRAAHDTSETGDDAADDQNEATAFMDALNAGRAITHPGEPPEGPDSPADDAEVQPPG